MESRSEKECEDKKPKGKNSQKDEIGLPHKKKKSGRVEGLSTILKEPDEAEEKRWERSPTKGRNIPRQRKNQFSQIKKRERTFLLVNLRPEMRREEIKDRRVKKEERERALHFPGKGKRKERVEGKLQTAPFL